MLDDLKKPDDYRVFGSGDHLKPKNLEFDFTGSKIFKSTWKMMLSKVLLQHKFSPHNYIADTTLITRTNFWKGNVLNHVRQVTEDLMLKSLSSCGQFGGLAKTALKLGAFSSGGKECLKLLCLQSNFNTWKEAFVVVDMLNFMPNPLITSQKFFLTKKANECLSFSQFLNADLLL